MLQLSWHRASSISNRSLNHHLHDPSIKKRNVGRLQVSDGERRQTRCAERCMFVYDPLKALCIHAALRLKGTPSF